MLEGRNAGPGEALPDRLNVVGGRRREGQRLLGVEPLLADCLGGHLAQRSEVGECVLEPALNAGIGIEMVVGDQRPEVVRRQRDEHRVDELTRTSGAVERGTGISR